MASASEWATRISEIETAIHDLHLGKRVVRLTSPDGTLVEYQQTDVDKLQRYLDYATAQKAKASGQLLGPIRVIPT